MNLNGLDELNLPVTMEWYAVSRFNPFSHRGLEQCERSVSHVRCTHDLLHILGRLMQGSAAGSASLKGFVIPTKSFVKIGITKIFVTTTKCLVVLTKRSVAAGKFLVAATKMLFVVPNFVAVTKPFFSVRPR